MHWFQLQYGYWLFSLVYMTFHMIMSKLYSLTTFLNLYTGHFACKWGRERSHQPVGWCSFRFSSTETRWTTLWWTGQSSSDQHWSFTFRFSYYWTPYWTAWVSCSRYQQWSHPLWLVRFVFLYTMINLYMHTRFCNSSSMSTSMLDKLKSGVLFF